MTPAYNDDGDRESVPPASDTLCREASKPDGGDAARLGSREPGSASLACEWRQLKPSEGSNVRSLPTAAEKRHSEVPVNPWLEFPRASRRCPCIFTQPRVKLAAF